MLTVRSPARPSSASPRRPDIDRHRRRAWLLLAAAAWNLWLWTTRISNLLTSEVERSAGFVAVHMALYVVSLGFTVAFAVVGWRMWREARQAAGTAAEDANTGEDADTGTGP